MMTGFEKTAEQVAEDYIQEFGFRQVRVAYGSLKWPGERDLAHDMLYAASEPLTSEV